MLVDEIVVVVYDIEQCIVEGPRSRMPGMFGRP